MAFLKKIETGFGTVGIWEITESVSELELKYQLSDRDLIKAGQITTEKRKKEFYIVRILLEKMLQFKPEIIYEETRKPKLANSSLKISISHSADLVVAFISEKNIGIDVEKLDRSIDKIAPRFLHPSEIDFVENKRNAQHVKIIIWSAKEAIFKSCKEQGIQFNRDIIIYPFSDEENKEFFGKRINIELAINFKLWLLLLKNNVVVYCVEEEMNKL